MMRELTHEEEKLRKLYLRDLATGKIQGPPTGKASVDMPWFQWYHEDAITLERCQTNIYDYFSAFAPDNVPLLEYYGREYYKNDIIDITQEYIGRFSSMGIKEGDTVSFMMLDVPEVLFSMFALSKLGATTNLIKFDESVERIRFMANKGKSDYMIISEVDFIVNNVLDSLKLGNNVKEVITVPITEMMSTTSVVELVYTQIMNKTKEKIKQAEEQQKQNEEKNNDKQDINTEKITIGNKISFFYQSLTEFISEQKKMKKRISANSKCLTFHEWKKKYPIQDANVITDGRDNVAVIVYTGGTTGHPKAVEITNDNMVAMAHDFRYSAFGFDNGKTSLNILPPGPSYYLNATYGLMCCGVKVNMISNFTISDYPKLIKKYKPNIFLSGPVLLNEIQKQDILDDTSFMTAPISGGDKYHLSEEESFNNYIKDNDHSVDDNHEVAIVHQGYGESESTAAATYAKTNASVLGTIGIPLLNVKVGIFDYQTPEEYQLAPPKEKSYGEIGEICITGPTIMRGYKGDVEETNKVLRLHSDGNYWLHTDDLGHMDQAGRLFHHGRAKRMLTRAGTKVWLGALEDAIMRHPNIENCCCVKRDDEIERESPVAYVVLKNDSDDTFAELDEIVRLAEGDSYVPQFYVKTDSIPVTEVNKKVDFKKLEEQDIFDSNKYTIEGKIVSEKTNRFVKQIK